MDADTEYSSRHGRARRLKLKVADFHLYLLSIFVASVFFPVFSIFIPILAVQVGADALELGLIGGASGVVYTFLPFIMGHFSDKRGSRSIFVIAAFSILVAVSLSYAVASHPLALVVGRVFEGIGWAMLWPVVEAGVSQDASRDPKKSQSIFNFVWSGAQALGPLVGTALVTTYSIRFAFLTGTVTMFATLVVLIASFLYKKKNQIKSGPKNENVRNAEDSSNRPFLFSVAKQLLMKEEPGRGLKLTLAIASLILCQASVTIMIAFFGPFARSVGIPIILIGIIAFSYGLTRFFIYLLITRDKVRGILLKPRNRQRNITAATAMACFSCLLILIPNATGVLYFAAFVILGAGFSLAFAITLVVMVAETKREEMGASAGLLESMLGIGWLIGPTTAGLISGGSLALPFAVPAIGFSAIMAFILFARTIRSIRNAPARNS